MGNAKHTLSEVCRLVVDHLTEDAESLFECHTVDSDPKTMDADVRKEYDHLLDLIAGMKNASVVASELLAALKRVMTLLECGALVRNTSGDGSPEWPIKMLALVQDLNAIQAAIAKAEGRA